MQPILRAPNGQLAGTLLKFLIQSKGDPYLARAAVEGSGSIHRDALVAEFTKSSVSPETVTGGGAALTGYVAATDFLAALRPFSIVERLPFARKVATNSRLVLFNGGTVGGEVLEGAPTPISAASLSNQLIRNRKFQAVIVTSAELARLMVPGAEAALAEDLAAAVAQAEDGAFLATVGASSTLTIVSSGSSIAQFDADLRALVALLIANRSTLVRGVIAMGILEFNYLATARASSDAMAYPSLSLPVPTLAGLPVLITGSTSGTIYVIDQAGVFITQAEVALDVTTEAAIQLDTAPDSPTTATSVMTSLFQEDLAATRCTLWRAFVARPTSVAILTNVLF